MCICGGKLPARLWVSPMHLLLEFVLQKHSLESILCWVACHLKLRELLSLEQSDGSGSLPDFFLFLLVWKMPKKKKVDFFVIGVRLEIQCVVSTHRPSNYATAI